MTKKGHRINFNLNRCCQWCNELFYSTDLRRKYCCKDCFEKATREKRRIYSINYYYNHKEKYIKYRKDYLNKIKT